MKVRLFFISLIIVLITLLVFTYKIWNPSENSKPGLKIEPQKLELTTASKYIPYNSYLTINLHLGTNGIPDFRKAKKIKRSNNTFREELIDLRNGLITLTGINYADNLSSCINSNYSIAIINSNKKEKDWLFAIEGIEKIDAKNCLDDFWIKKSEKGAEITKEKYKNQEISISDSNDKTKIATALTEDNVILFSSKLDLIHQAIDISDDPIKNQIGNNKMNTMIKKLEDGVLLINASPEAMEKLLEIPKFILDKIEPNSFAASIMLKQNIIYLDSIFELKDKVNQIENQSLIGLEMLDYKFRNSRDIAIISKPKEILNSDDNDLYSQAIVYYLRNSLKKLDSQIVEEIIELDSGPIILAKNQDDWIIGSSDNSNITEISKKITAKDFTESTLNYKDKTFNIWYKPSIIESKNSYQLSTKLGVVSSQESDKIVWSNQISNIEEKNDSEQPILSKIKLNENNQRLPGDFTHHVYLSSDSAKKILNQWKPLLLLKTVEKNTIQSYFKNLVIAVGTEEENEKSILHLHGMLSIN